MFRIVDDYYFGFTDRDRFLYLPLWLGRISFNGGWEWPHREHEGI